MTPISSVEKFRVLAIQADPPEVAPNESTTHRVLFADPEGDGREISFLWLTCLDEIKPTTDFSTACEIVGFHVGTAESGGDEYIVPGIPQEAITYPENKCYAMATTILSACAGGAPLDETALTEMEGVGDLESLCEGGEHILAFKTFRISVVKDEETGEIIKGPKECPDPEENRNTNPQISKIRFNKKPLDDIFATDSKPGAFKCDTITECFEGAKIEVKMTEESFESYQEIRFDKLQDGDEAPYISWFVTGGKLGTDRSRTAEPPGPFKTTWSPPLDGGTFSLWVVAHDLRGGTSWKQYTVKATTPDRE